MEVRKRLYRLLWLPCGELYIRTARSSMSRANAIVQTRGLGGMIRVAGMTTRSSQDLDVCQWKRQQDFLTGWMWESKKSRQISKFFPGRDTWGGKDCESRKLKGQGYKSRVLLRTCTSAMPVTEVGRLEIDVRVGNY